MLSTYIFQIQTRYVLAILSRYDNYYTIAIQREREEISGAEEEENHRIQSSPVQSSAGPLLSRHTREQRRMAAMFSKFIGLTDDVHSTWERRSHSDGRKKK